MGNTKSSILQNRTRLQYTSSPANNAYWQCDVPTEHAGLNKCRAVVGCRNNGDCKDGLSTCRADGQCRQCENASECAGDKQFCESNGKCAPWAPENPPFCKTEQDCNTQSPPANNAYWQCDSPTQFPGLNKCRAVVGCRNNSDCKDGVSTCRNGTCKQCDNASECGPNQFCESNGKCAPWAPQNPPFCKTEQDCNSQAPPAHNAYWTCDVETQFAGLNKCRASVGCRSNNDCRDGSSTCRADGICKECERTSECGPNQFCENNKCVNYAAGFCKTDANCAGKKCKNIDKVGFEDLGVCLECSETADCGNTNQFCENTKCVNYAPGFCRSDANCQSEFECTNFNASFVGLGTCAIKKNAISGYWVGQYPANAHWWNINADTAGNINGSMFNGAQNLQVVGKFVGDGWVLGVAGYNFGARLNNGILNINGPGYNFNFTK